MLFKAFVLLLQGVKTGGTLADHMGAVSSSQVWWRMSNSDVEFHAHMLYDISHGHIVLIVQCYTEYYEVYSISW